MTNSIATENKIENNLGVPGLSTRLYDYLLKGGGINVDGTPLVAPNLPVFEITRFSKFIRETLSDWNFSDLNLAPPFEDFYMERTVRSCIEGVVPVVVGVRVTAKRAKDTWQPLLGLPDTSERESRPEGVAFDGKFYEAKWVVTFQIMYSDAVLRSTTLRDIYRHYMKDGVLAGNLKMSSQELEDNVKQVPDYWLKENIASLAYDYVSATNKIMFFVGSRGEVVARLLGGLAPDKSPLTEEMLKENKGFFYGQVFPFAMAVSYLNNPKNLDKRICNRAERKMAQREGLKPNSDYYVLRVHDFEKYLREQANAGFENPASSAPLRLHISRGNWAMYTPEAPLFGRIVGRVFRPHCVKGNKSLGEIRKDYSVE